MKKNKKIGEIFDDFTNLSKEKRQILKEYVLNEYSISPSEGLIISYLLRRIEVEIELPEDEIRKAILKGKEEISNKLNMGIIPTYYKDPKYREIEKKLNEIVQYFANNGIKWYL
ncbi:MAG: hypothetical protein QW051_04120 [Candidatus Aenigmatarchaeota archaeon]